VRKPRYFRPSQLALACALILCGCSLYPSGASGPTPALSVVQATDLGVFGTNAKIIGRDGGYSGVFGANVVWLFGDTFLSQPNAAGATLISDSWAWTTDLDASSGITGFQERDDAAGAPTMILTLTASEQAFNAAHQGNPCQQRPCGARWALWPAAMVADPARNRALVFYQLVSAQPGNFNFQAVGYSVATWPTFAGLPLRPVINPDARHPDLLFAENEPSFGSAALVVGDTLYAYGCTSSDFAVPCKLGRVDLANVDDRSAWTFYAENGTWSSELSDAIAVFTGNSIASVSWNEYLQQYVAVYNSPLSVNVKMRTAPNPEGPWSREVAAFAALSPVNGGSPVSDAQAHPEYNLNGGQTMFVSYSHATGLLSSEFHLVSVQIASIGPP
jgi:Domain of unknown function (DUF4185)